MRAVVLALADLGRSARMQYHARALAASGADVDFVGYEGTALPQLILGDPKIRVHRISPSTLRLRRGSSVTFAVVAVFDTIRVAFRLWRKLRTLERPTLIVAQNPPAFPTLAVTWFALHRKGVRFVTDWHNLGYSVLGLRMGRTHPAVR